MNRSYRGNARPFAAVLCAEDDLESLSPVLEELQRQNKALCCGKAALRKSVLKRASVVILFLTERFGDSRQRIDAVLYARSLDLPLLPVDMPGASCPEILTPFLYARNHIDASRYPTAEELGKRLAEAESLQSGLPTAAQKRARRISLTAVIAVAALFAVLAVIGYRSGVVERIFSPAPAEARTIPAKKIFELTEADLKSFRCACIIGDTLVETDNPFQCVTDVDDVITSVDGVAFEPGDTALEAYHYIWTTDDYGHLPLERVTTAEEEDFSIIEKMTNLEVLALFEQQLTELPDLSGLKKLKKLYVMNCPVESLDVLSSCKSLEKLYLFNTDITDLTPLSGCESLKELRLMDFRRQTPRIASFGGFRSDSLETVHLMYCEHLGPFFNEFPDRFPNLVTIRAGFQHCDSLSFLRNMPKLKNLIMFNCDEERVDEIASVLSSLSGLTGLGIESGSFDSLDFLHGMTSLEELYLATTPKNRDYSPVAGHPSLYFIDLEAFSGSDTEFLQGIKSPAELILIPEKETDFSGLSHVSRYTCLDVSARELKEPLDAQAVFRGLEGAEAVDELYLQNARLTEGQTVPSCVKHMFLTDCRVPSLDMEEFGGVPVTLAGCYE